MLPSCATSDALAKMRRVRGVGWAVYQNAALDSESLGDIRFLAYGPAATFAAPPARYPDSPLGPGWRYVLVGWVDIETGRIMPGAPATPPVSLVEAVQNDA